ncbi:ribose-phosphate pyrophosphokinase, partial [bacterium]|nr:ribose-phosphate pyrophosphokinase [bacterium]
MYNELKIFSGNSNRALSEEISSFLGIPLGDALIQKFSDGEIFTQIKENVRGKDVFIIQSTCPPVNDHLMEFLIMVDALKRASAKRITAVLPYYGYARQDRKVQPRVPITAKLVADLITAIGVSRVVSIDLHVGQIQGFFDLPFDHLFAAPVLVEYFKKKNIKDLVVISPDVGGIERARIVANKLNVGLAIIDKRRSGPNVAEVMHVIGDIQDKNVLIVDDMIDTAGSLVSTVKSITEKGAKDVYACCSHPVFSGPAYDRILNSKLKEVVVTNTIPVKENIAKGK